MKEEYLRYMEVARALTGSTDIDDLIRSANKISKAIKANHDLDYIANYVETGNIYGTLADFLDRTEVNHPTQGTIPFRLYPFQRDLADTIQKNRQVVICHGRQLGITTMLCGAGLFEAVSKPDQTVMVTSFRFAAALEMLDRMKVMLRSAGLNDAMLGHQPIVVTRSNKGMLELDNGSRIIARTANENAARGMSVSSLIIDGANFVSHGSAESFMASILPTISLGGRIVMAGTAGLPTGFFWDAFTGKTFPQAARVHLPCSVHPERDESWMDQQRAQLGQKNFRTEIEAEFVSLPIAPL